MVAVLLQIDNSDISGEAEVEENKGAMCVLNTILGSQ